jgi:hypothetical protein
MKSSPLPEAKSPAAPAAPTSSYMEEAMEAALEPDINETVQRFEMSASIAQELEAWRRFAEAKYDVAYAASFAYLVVPPQRQKDSRGAQLPEKKGFTKLDNICDLAYLALHAPPPYNEVSRAAYWRLIEEVSGGAVKCAEHGVPPERDRRNDSPCVV